MNLQTIILLGIGLMTACLLLWIPVSMYIKMKSCKVQIQGRYVEHKRRSVGRGNGVYTPVFRYVYNKKTYEEPSLISYSSARKIKKKYEPGNKYVIWVDETNPKNYITQTKSPFQYCILFIIGSILLVGTVYMGGVLFLL